LLLLLFLYWSIVLSSPPSSPSWSTTPHTTHHTILRTTWGKQYLDPIIQATHTTDGAMIDICKSLGSCLREPKNIVSPGFCLSSSSFSFLPILDFLGLSGMVLRRSITIRFLSLKSSLVCEDRLADDKPTYSPVLYLPPLLRSLRSFFSFLFP
jgi:hypothetical protein